MLIRFQRKYLLFFKKSIILPEKNEDFPEQSIAAVSVDNNGAQYVAFFMAFGMLNYK